MALSEGVRNLAWCDWAHNTALSELHGSDNDKHNSRRIIDA